MLNHFPVSKIESIVQSIPYEKDPYDPYQYSPEDFKWYLLNFGWRKIDYDHRSILVPKDDYLYHLQLQYIERPDSTMSNYKGLAERGDLEVLPGNPRLYYPFGRLEGEMSPVVTFHLLIDLGEENYGAVWTGIPLSYFADKSDIRLLKVADSFSGFLEQVSSYKKLQPIAEEHNEALFLRLLENYLASAAIRPTTAAAPEELLDMFFRNSRDQFVADGARNLEFQFRAYGQRMENARQFAERADLYATKLDNPYWLPGPIQRRQIKFGSAGVFEERYWFNQVRHGYRILSVESIVGEKNRLTESYLVYHNEHEDLWSLVRRYNAEIADVKVKELGTFSFDSTSKWKLKKKTAPAWSELPAEVYIEGEEDALTPERISFAVEVMARADFKPVLEAYISGIYTKYAYPDFEAMNDEEKEEYAADYPKLNTPQEIWRTLGKKSLLHIENNTAFQFHTPCTWDPEHGVTVRVEDWKIKN